jgi:hypothetical protein
MRPDGAVDASATSTESTPANAPPCEQLAASNSPSPGRVAAAIAKLDVLAACRLVDCEPSESTVRKFCAPCVTKPGGDR